MVTVDALLLGGGAGKRFSAPDPKANADSLPKQFRPLAGTPVFIHSLRALLRLGSLRQIVMVVPKNYVGFTQELVATHFPEGPRTKIHVIEGGDQRQDSSRLGLEYIESLGPVPDRVLIHDACRPYLSSDLLERIRTALLDRSYGAWVPVVPVVDTLKRIENHQVVETVDRSVVQRVQTPQIFEYSVIRDLIEKTKSTPDINFTDDASLCEYFGIPVGVFEGDVRNIKLTYEFELQNFWDTMIASQKEIACEPELATTFTV